MIAQEILKLIEEVDPADTEMLDSIDARVSVFINEWSDYKSHILDYKRTKISDPNYWGDNYKEFTRSRDALKAIRPEGWEYACSYTAGKWVELWKADNAWRCVANDLPTEELAELHAIISAIDYERNNK